MPSKTSVHSLESGPKGHAPTDGRDSGSVLMLMPAALLVMIMLGSIAFDFALVRQAERDLLAAASAAANDAVTAGLDEATLRRTGEYHIDPGRARAVVYDSLAARGILDGLAGPPTITMVSTTEVRVDLELAVTYLFARAIPGGPHGATARAGASALVVQR